MVLRVALKNHVAVYKRGEIEVRDFVQICVTATDNSDDLYRLCFGSAKRVPNPLACGQSLILDNDEAVAELKNDLLKASHFAHSSTMELSASLSRSDSMSGFSITLGISAVTTAAVSSLR